VRPSIHAVGLSSEHITLTSPAESEFDPLVRSLFRGNSEELLKLKPFLVIVSNDSPRTMVAYTLRWEIELPLGRRSTSKYPDAVGGSAPMRGNEICPGEQQIVPKDMEIDCGRWNGSNPTEDFYLRQSAERCEEFADATDIRIGFDAVIFEDGEAIGPNMSSLCDHFAAYVNAKQDFCRSLVQNLDSGQSMDEAFRPIEMVIANGRANPRISRKDALALWPREAAAELRLWRKQHGEAALPGIIRRAVRKEPFVIRRRDEPSGV
jgi:hypothetical protein